MKRKVSPGRGARPALFALGLLLCASAAAGPAPLWSLLSQDGSTASTKGTHAPGPTLIRVALIEEAPVPGSEVTLSLPEGEHLQLRLLPADDGGGAIVTLKGGSALNDHALLSFGGGGVFGRIDAGSGRYMVNTDASGTWLLKLDDPRLNIDDCPGQPFGAHIPTSPPARTGLPEPMQIDVMFIYTPDMQERYPGALLPARLAHLVAVANQALVDSEAPVLVRMVHHQPIPYLDSPSNFDALPAMRAAVNGEKVPGLTGLDQVRAQHGADIVVLTWPQDIETRGSCGVTYLPDDSSGSFDASAGVQISNDGISNWSVCSDNVFAHELGHNLGAVHQRFIGSAPGINFAHVVDGRYHTIMGSFGSAHVDRFKRLNVFSNPDILCGGAPCGSMAPDAEANIVETMRGFAPVVAGYASTAHPGTVSPPSPSDPDSDGDGVSDWLDPFPFDPFDGNPPPPPEPPAFSPIPILPGEGDPDQFELLVLDSGSDQVRAYDLQGRLLRIVASLQPVDPRPALSEYSALDVDAEGRLYLLASSDVRRYSRDGGHLLDVFLSSAQPLPRQLLSGFSRSMGFDPQRSQLVVLGDVAVERYDLAGTRISVLVGPSDQDPQNWNQAMPLPLRAFAFDNDNRFFLAEAAQQRVMGFEVGSGERIADPAPVDNAVVLDPWDLSMGPDAMLYLADGSSDRVLRLDPSGAAAPQVFIAAGSGGLDFARALAFGPDGHLYVASRGNRRVLRFDGTSGAFLGVVVGVGLDSPERLLITPRLALDLFRDGFE